MHTNEIEERFDLLDASIERNLVIRHAWRQGENRACLLLTLAPEIESDRNSYVVDYCPSELLPLWLAGLTPEIDDRGTEEAWPAMIRRYARVVRRAALTLDSKQWRFVWVQFQTRVIRKIAERHALTKLQAESLEYIERTGKMLLPDKLAVRMKAATYGKNAPPPQSVERAVGNEILDLEMFHWKTLGEQARSYRTIAVVQVSRLRTFFIGIANEPITAAGYETEAWDIYANLLLDTIEAALPPEGPVDEHQNSI